MSPEPDLIDSILLFILIKEEHSCSSLSLHPLHPPHEGALCKAVIDFICVAADRWNLRTSNRRDDGAGVAMELGVSPPSQPSQSLDMLALTFLCREAMPCGADHGGFQGS